MIMRRTLFLLGLAAIVAASAVPATAGPIMPNLGAVPVGWSTDRYNPAVFANVGTFQGRSDVLGIGISTADSLTSRPGGYHSNFYNTQGKQHAVTGGAGSWLSADLWIPAELGAQGAVSFRSDIWGVMTDGTDVSDYPIIGFTNYGGARYRVWDDTGWHDLLTTVSYDAWTSFGIEFTGSAYVYRINGNIVYTDSAIDGSTGFSAVIMQAYNFGDPAIQGANVQDYTAYWSNPVPDGGATFALFGGALIGLGALRRKFRG
jgi:hypothetical protein